MSVRTRTEADLNACVQLAVVVHRVDGYPPYLPGDLRSFVASPGVIEAWVAERNGEIVGHVALHGRSSDAVMALAAGVTGRPPDRIGVVARLFVAPAAREDGVGGLLLGTAASAAVELGLWPILDVAAQFDAAISLYEKCGWRCAGRVTVHFGDATSLDEVVYVAPDPGPEG